MTLIISAIINISKPVDGPTNSDRFSYCYSVVIVVAYSLFYAAFSVVLWKLSKVKSKKQLEETYPQYSIVTDDLRLYGKMSDETSVNGARWVKIKEFKKDCNYKNTVWFVSTSIDSKRQKSQP